MITSWDTRTTDIIDYLKVHFSPSALSNFQVTCKCYGEVDGERVQNTLPSLLL